MPLTRQQIYRRRRITVFSFAAFVLLAAFYLPMTLLAPLGSIAAQPVAYTPPEPTAARLSVPDYGASGIAAIGYDGLLAKGGTEEPLPIASISKVITTLVVLDKHPIAPGEQGQTLTFTEADVSVYYDYIAQNGRVLPVSAGLQLSQREVLELMLIGSGNNYARSLVNWAFGSEAKYAAAARTWLDQHGLTSTQISDATGMSPKNRSTPSDLVAIGKLAIADPVVAEIIAMKKVSIDGVADVPNTNNLLGVDGIDGIKTGTLDEAGSCLLFSADIPIGDESVTVVGVVLGAHDHGVANRGVRSLLESVIAGFQEVSLATAGERFATYSTEWGESATAVAAEDSSAVVWSDTPVTATIQAAPVSTAPEGDRVGTVTFRIGERSVEVPLTLDEAIADPGPWWRLTNPGGLF